MKIRYCCFGCLKDRSSIYRASSSSSSLSIVDMKWKHPCHVFSRLIISINQIKSIDQPKSISAHQINLIHWANQPNNNNNDDDHSIDNCWFWSKQQQHQLTDNNNNHRNGFSQTKMKNKKKHWIKRIRIWNKPIKKVVSFQREVPSSDKKFYCFFKQRKFF